MKPVARIWPRSSSREWILPEPKLLLQHRILPMCCLHILICLRNWDVKVQAERQDRSCDEHYENAKRCVLEICDLDLHWSELNTPADIVPFWRWLKADMLPVCALEVLEVVSCDEVELFEILGEDDDGVPDEEMSKVRCEE